ncbi:GntR family transcriptional regulator [Cohaesibacter haloalkalitolerans]|uniref:GntR family transcriptional regulator n=1 Tax=Cohaesibacter haloalkalitolerans TaxID=1162980 RepID=UPI000E64B0A1|nr:GntR family transcriptional regulator [Cohaesibacter haloalkalitolerans]
MKLSDKAYEKFKQHLMMGDLKPGQFISQRELVTLTGVPLAPVREALLRLELEGVVQIAPQRGIQIVEVSLRFIKDTYQLRMMIEKEAAAKFAGNASDAMISRLREVHRTVIARVEEEGTSDGLLKDAQGIDDSLHDTIVSALGNELVDWLYAMNNQRIQLIRLSHGHLTLITPGTFRQVMIEHMAIIEALESHDPVAAAAAIEKHLTAALHRALGL